MKTSCITYTIENTETYYTPMKLFGFCKLVSDNYTFTMYNQKDRII